MRIIPRLDIKSDYLIKSIRYDGLKNLGKPELFAKKYYKDGATEIIVIDTVASLYKRKTSFETVKKISNQINIPLTVCGGIKDIYDVENAFNNGADKVALNTHLFFNTNLIYDISNTFGMQSCIISIDVKRVKNGYECLTNGGRDRTNIQVVDWIKQVQDIGIGEIYLSSVDNDGTHNGFDIKLIEDVCKVIKVPLVVSSGMGHINDLIDIKKLKEYISGVSIGSMFHYNNISISEVKEFFNE